MMRGPGVGEQLMNGKEGHPTMRLLVEGPLKGAANMARDEALMTLVGADRSPPTLRLYRWLEPTISLGYFQHYADFAELPPPAGRLPVVRRLTGGGAILHDLELTYSITLTAKHPLNEGGPNRLYQLAHDALIRCLREQGLSTSRCGFTDQSSAARGPFFCFERRHCFDVLFHHEKLAGSAQRRTRTAVLQHGSIVLGSRFAQQPTARPPADFAPLVAAVSERFPECLAEEAGLALEPGGWSDAELTLANQLTDRYASADWTRRS
jgi:lipoate-protein ligase A